MNPRQARALLSLYAVEVFLETNSARLPRTCATGTWLSFKRALAELELHVQVQSGARLMAMGLTSAKDAKREALLRDHLASIVRIAKLESASNPDLSSIKMPRGEPGTQKLAAFAAGMAAVAADHREIFVAAGMKPTFVDEFDAAIDDLLATITERSERRGAHSGATQGVAASLKACQRYKAVLASFIESELRDDESLLTNWRSVQRIGRSSRHRQTTMEIASGASTAALGVPALPIRDTTRLLSSPNATRGRA